jgi:hypothetical protein
MSVCKGVCVCMYVYARVCVGVTASVYVCLLDALRVLPHLSPSPHFVPFTQHTYPPSTGQDQSNAQGSRELGAHHQDPFAPCNGAPSPWPCVRSLCSFLTFCPLTLLLSHLLSTSRWLLSLRLELALSVMLAYDALGCRMLIKSAANRARRKARSRHRNGWRKSTSSCRPMRSTRVLAYLSSDRLVCFALMRNSCSTPDRMRRS